MDKVVDVDGDRNELVIGAMIGAVFDDENVR